MSLRDDPGGGVFQVPGGKNYLVVGIILVEEGGEARGQTRRRPGHGDDEGEARPALRLVRFVPWASGPRTRLPARTSPKKARSTTAIPARRNTTDIRHLRLNWTGGLFQAGLQAGVIGGGIKLPPHQFPPGRGPALGLLRLGQSLPHGLGQKPGLLLGHQPAGFSRNYRFVDPVHIRGHYRHLKGQGLEDDVGEAVPVAALGHDTGHDELVGPAEKIGDLVVGHVPQESHPAVQGIFPHQTRQVTALGAVPGQGEAEIHPPFLKIPAGGQKIGKALFLHQAPQGQELIRRGRGPGLPRCRGERCPIRDMHNFSGGRRGQVCQVALVGVGDGAHEAGRVQLLHQRPIRRVDVVGVAAKTEGDATQLRGHPGRGGRAVGPGRVDMINALVPENAGQVHPRQGRPPSLTASLEGPPAPQGHLPQKCGRLRTPVLFHPGQTPQQFPGRRQSQMMNRGLYLRHALKALRRAGAIEGVDGEVQPQTRHGVDLVQDKGLGGLRKPQKNIGDARGGHVSRGEDERFDFFLGAGGPRRPGGGSPWPRRKTGPAPAPGPSVRGSARFPGHLRGVPGMR